MHLSPERANSVTLCALALHNFLLKSSSKGIYCFAGLIDQEDSEGNITPGRWRSENLGDGFVDISPQCHGNNIAKNAKHFREVFTDYFMNEDAVSR